MAKADNPGARRDAEAPRPRPRNRAQTIPRRRDAAADLLERKGPDGFGLAELGREAEVSFGLIHHYFGGKEGLLRAVVQRALGRMGREIRRTQEEGEFWSKDAPAVLITFDTFARHPALARLMAWGLLTGLLRIEDLEDQVRRDREAIGAMIESFREGSPGTSKESAGAQFTLLLSAVFGYNLLKPLLEEGYNWTSASDETLRKQLVRAMGALAKPRS